MIQKILLIFIIINLLIAVEYSNYKNNYFSVGITPGLIIPGQNYKNEFNLGGQIGYQLDSIYGIYTSYKFSALKSKLDTNNVNTIQLIFLSLRKVNLLKEELIINTAFGIGNINIDKENNPGFLFGVDFTYPLNADVDIGVSLENYMENLKIPFISFPDFSIYAQGGGDQFLLINFFLNYLF